MHLKFYRMHIAYHIFDFNKLVLQQFFYYSKSISVHVVRLFGCAAA